MWFLTVVQSAIDVPCLVFELHDDEWRKARQTALLSFCT